MGQFTTLLEQTFQGARVVKSYSMEEYEKKHSQITPLACHDLFLELRS